MPRLPLELLAELNYLEGLQESEEPEEMDLVPEIIYYLYHSDLSEF